MSNSNEKILYRVFLSKIHERTENTRHIVFGKTAARPSELRIVQFEGDSGFYLIHFNENSEELTDTYHDSCKDAMKQAEFEFGIVEHDWTK